MKIAITGGSGFIGSALNNVLSKNNSYDVINLDINNNNMNSNFKYVDITDLSAVTSALKGIDVVYHLAGTVVGPVRKNPFIGLSINVEGTRNNLESCIRNNVDKILFASSFYIYDGSAYNEDLNEESVIDISKSELFGGIKYFSESMIKTYSTKYSLDYNILRFGSAYGPGKCSNVVVDFIDHGLSGKTIEIWGKGERKNQYTYVEDIVSGLVASLNTKNEIYNLISPWQTTTKELANMINEIFGVDIIYKLDKTEQDSMPYISSEKAIKELRWEPTKINEGLRKTIDFMKKRG